MIGSADLGRRLTRLAAVFISMMVIVGVGISAASSSAAAAEAPEWVVNAYSSPTNLAPGGAGELIVTAVDVGGATDGSVITLEDTLPTGVEATRVKGIDVYADGPLITPYISSGEGALSCKPLPALTCTDERTVLPGDQVVMTINVKAEASAASGLDNEAKVSGGGASAARALDPIAISGERAPFGFAPGSVFAAVSSHEAGAHANVTTGFAMRSTGAGGLSSGDPKDVVFNLPPGLVGQTVGVPKCTAALAEKKDCPADTIVGVATVYFRALIYPARDVVPVFNIEPSPGEPAAFLFDALGFPTRLDTSVLSDGDDAVRVSASDIEQTEPVIGGYVTIWGVPAYHEAPGPIHLAGDESAGIEHIGNAGNAASPVPLLSNPTQCAVPLVATVETDWWRRQGAFEAVEAPMGSMTECERPPFDASLSVLPDTLAAGAPAGYTVDLQVPQFVEATRAATANVQKVVTTLPLGTVISPSAAQGLAACSNEEFFDNSRGEQQPASPGKCPDASKVGTVEIKTPALQLPLTGAVYLAQPECHPCTPEDAQDGKMVRLFIQVVGEGESGIVVKLEGHGSIDQSSGQLTVSFEDDPQLPFSELELVLGGGARATLANSRTCGSAITRMELTPWTTPFGPTLTRTSSFEVNQSCFGPQFSPSFKAGMPNIQAGAHGQLTLAFGREDHDEFLGGISVQMPEGLLGSLTGIPLCKEAEANAGTCGQTSEIGTVEALTGPGANPFLVSGGHVYLTEGYGGSQFGLSIVVPAVAGPYTLGGVDGRGRPADSGTVVVRSQIFIDEHTAQLTVTSGKLPSMLDGIPLQLKAVNVRIDRSGFMFNPTSCERKQITGTLTAVEGLSANVASPFQVTNCAALAFKPGFTATTKKHHTRKGGAYLQVSVTSGEGQADIAKARVELPKKLPSRLSTLQQACTEAQFDANPAGCPPASDVGTVLVHTPVLPVPLTGPAYFVSRGAQWPELIMVLQGYGVTVDLAGETHISKSGITSTTLNAVPDVPFTSFTLTLPEGDHSALAGNGNLCKKKLVMPIALTGQNGALVERNTKVKVGGCSATRKKHKHKNKNKEDRGKHGKKHKGKARHKGNKNRAGKAKNHAGKAKEREVRK